MGKPGIGAFDLFMIGLQLMLIGLKLTGFIDWGVAVRARAHNRVSRRRVRARVRPCVGPRTSAANEALRTTDMSFQEAKPREGPCPEGDIWRRHRRARSNSRITTVSSRSSTGGATELERPVVNRVRGST